MLLSVHCDSSDEVSTAKDVLKAAGAEDISSAGEKSVSTHGVDTHGRNDDYSGRSINTNDVETTQWKADQFRQGRKPGCGSGCVHPDQQILTSIAIALLARRVQDKFPDVPGFFVRQVRHPGNSCVGCCCPCGQGERNVKRKYA